MKEYTILFEFYGRKMKTTIEAYDIEDAKLKIQEKIIFHKLTITKDDGNNDNCYTNNKQFIPDDQDTMDFLKSIFKFK